MSDTNQNTEQIEQNTVSDEKETQSQVVESTESAIDSNNDNADENQKPKFEVDEESDEESDGDGEPDLSKYTVLDADNLDEDEPILGQEFALFSFMSPEGIMNCNIRALKFRGAFPTLEKANEHAEKLKKKDKYFKIHAAESGKWVEFDPPEEHVEQVVAGNKKQQKIVDAQRKARMDKMNELAGRHKQNIEKTDRGAAGRIDESKKAAAAEDYANKRRAKTQAKKASRQEKVAEQVNNNTRGSRNEAMRERLRKKLEAKKASDANKNRLNKTRGQNTERTVTADERFGSGQVGDDGLKKKTDVVNQASEELETKKSELQRTNANIDKIRKMMQKK